MSPGATENGPTTPFIVNPVFVLRELWFVGSLSNYRVIVLSKTETNGTALGLESMGQIQDMEVALWEGGVLVLKLEIAHFYIDIEWHSQLLVPTSHLHS